ncbi:hypothetical protein C8T65DRAFT_672889 [Cerioporus squamosus]|nr:hypothetical protein C8T65DRAFT_672889 [Cerioporus squamosus]
MQFKSFITLASLAALAVAAPNEVRDSPDVEATLTTHFTTETFTATRVLQSFRSAEEPWVTTITTPTTWTVAHTVTRQVGQ